MEAVLSDAAQVAITLLTIFTKISKMIDRYLFIVRDSHAKNQGFGS